MPPKKKNTKSNQIQPENSVDQIIQNVVQDFVNKNTSTTSVSAASQEIPTLKKGTRKPRTTKKKDLSSQQESNESNVIDPSVSPVIKAETQQQEVIPTKKKPGRKPKVKKQEVKEEPQEQLQQQHMSMTVAPQQQLLFINATPAEPVKKKPGRKPKAKKQEEAKQNQQHPLSEEKIVNTQQKSTAIPTSSPAAIRNLINFDEDSYSPYNFNKGKNLSEPQNNGNHNSPPLITPSPVIQPVIAPITTPISTVTPPAPAPSKRGRPKKVKVDSQTVNATSTPDVTESHDTKPAPTRKRKSRKQEALTELDKQSDIVAGESQQQQTEEVEQPTTSAKATKKRRTKKQDAANTPALESTSIEQTPIQNDQQPPVKTKRGRPKKIKPNDIVVDKPAVNEETAAISMEKVNDTEKSVIGSRIVEPQLSQHKSSVSEDLQVPSEQQEPIDSAMPNIGPKNSSVVLNENTEMSEQEKLAVSINPQTVNKDEDVKLTDVTMEDAQDKEEETVNSPVGEQSAKKRSLSNSDSDNEDIDHQPAPKKLSRIEEVKARMEKFSKLRSRMGEGESANRKEVYDEHQRKKTNPKEMIRQERKREEAEKLLAKQQAEERGEDYERSKFWEYSIDSVEKWEKKQEKKAKKSDVAFTDYNQVAHKKYKKQINELKPDLATYNEQKAAAMASSSLITTEDGQVVSVDTESNFYRDANSLQYASVDNRPSQESIDKVVADVNKTIAKREKSSRQKTVNEEDDITYINERNRRFNEKIGRFYDKYTKEIKENFERGTAL